MTDEDRDYYASLSPQPIRMTERQWVEVFLDNKADIKKLFLDYIASAKEKLVSLNKEKIQFKQEYTDWNDIWALELLLEMTDANIVLLKKYVKKCGFLLSDPAKAIPGKITEADIVRAKEVPIESLYEGKLRKVGNRLVGKCPFHEEKTASFCIYADQNSFWCFGCSVGGSAVDYVMKRDNVKFLEAVKILLK